MSEPILQPLRILVDTAERAHNPNWTGPIPSDTEVQCAILDGLEAIESAELAISDALYALSFVADICEEALETARVGTGEEVALRHAARKAREALAKVIRQSAPVPS